MGPGVHDAADLGGLRNPPGQPALYRALSALPARRLRSRRRHRRHRRLSRRGGACRGAYRAYPAEPRRGRPDAGAALLRRPVRGCPRRVSGIPRVSGIASAVARLLRACAVDRNRNRCRAGTHVADRPRAARSGLPRPAGLAGPAGRRVSRGAGAGSRGAAARARIRARAFRANRRARPVAAGARIAGLADYLSRR